MLKGVKESAMVVSQLIHAWPSLTLYGCTIESDGILGEKSLMVGKLQMSSYKQYFSSILCWLYIYPDHVLIALILHQSSILHVKKPTQILNWTSCTSCYCSEALLRKTCLSHILTSWNLWMRLHIMRYTRCKEAYVF